MKHRLLPLFALPLMMGTARAQVYAGQVPDGMGTIDLNIDMMLAKAFTVDSASLELDCDDFNDARAVLFRGVPEVDGTSYALLHWVDDDIEVCMDMETGWQQRPHYYAYGEPLDCGSGFAWQLTSELVLGDYGGWVAIGPLTMDSAYIAYRRGTQVGWIGISFNLSGNPNVSLRIDEVLPLCPVTTGIATHEAGTLLLSPNPVEAGPIRIGNTEAPRAVEVIDATGRVIARYTGPVNTIPSPGETGAYLVRAVFADGQRYSARFVRY